MSTYKFKVSKPEDIDIPRICRENADQDAFVILSGDKIYYAVKSELNTNREVLCGPCSVPTWVNKPGDVKLYEGFVFGWDYVGEASWTKASAQDRTTLFFKQVADSRAERSRKKILVTVIAKD